MAHIDDCNAGSRSRRTATAGLCVRDVVMRSSDVEDGPSDITPVVKIDQEEVRCATPFI